MAVAAEDINRWLFELFLRRESLADFEEAMFALASLCKDRDEFDLIVHSAEKLVALSEAQYSKQIQYMTKYIRDVVLDDQPLAIVATAWGKKPDSSQQLVQRLKVHFRTNANVAFFNSVNAYEKKNFMAEFPRFVLVDEFSGTGSTLKSRMNHLQNNAKSKGLTLHHNICILFGMEAAVSALRDEGLNTHFCTELKAGISGYFKGAERNQKITLMKRLEEELAQEIDGTPVPSLGYGQAEALFFIREMNAPNSNFPVFWWPLDSNNSERQTVMSRAEL